MRIASLIDHLECLEPLARLHHEEWRTVSPFKTVDQHVAKLRSRIGPEAIPATFVLLVEGRTAGSVSLLHCDDIANMRPDLSAAPS